MSNKTTVFAIIANKGGVGKSTTAAALITNLATRPGYKNYVLGMSLDSQGDLDDLLQAQIPDTFPTLREQLLTPGTTLRGYRFSRDFPAFLVPSDLRMELVPTELITNGSSLQERFLEGIKKITSADYHYVIIDTPPQLNEYMRAAISAADGVVVVANPSPIDIKQVCNALQYANLVAADQHAQSKVLGILFTRDEHFNINHEVIDTLEGRFPGLPFKTTISRTVLVQEALMRDPFRPLCRNVAAREYAAFTEEMLNRIKE